MPASSSYSRYLSAESTSGLGAELDVIAAAAIGGASLAGGVGSVEGAVIGAALAGVIANGVVLVNVDTYAQQAITGAVIIIAVSIDVLRNRMQRRPSVIDRSPLRGRILYVSSRNIYREGNAMKTLQFSLSFGIAAVMLPFAAAAQPKDTASVVIAMVPKGPIPWFIDCDAGAKAEAENLA